MRTSRLAIAALALAMLAFAPQAQAGKSHDSDSSEELRDAVTLDGISKHMRKLQAIADAHQNNRSAGTIGYEASAAYVERKLRKAGYDTHFSPFDFPTWHENSTPELEQLTPTPTNYVAGVNPDDDDNPAVDFITFEFSASGEVSAPVVPTNDIVIPPVGAADGNTSGCEPEDFPAETAGAISLIQRGTCPFVQKLANAADADAAGVILFNEGNPDRTNVIARIGEPYFPVPAVGASFAVGEELYNAFQAGESPTVRIKVDATTQPRRQDNVIADSPWGNEDRTVVVGAHLDSVPAGPGINDNGSGTMTDLEVAEQLGAMYEDASDKMDRGKKMKRKAKRADSARKLRTAKRKIRGARDDLKPFKRQSVRFAFWGAEEAGLIGSSQYVAQLSEDERAQILLNLNFDMLASPNYARLVYDGNTDETEPPPGGSPPGSDVIEQVFLDYFESQDLPTQPTAFDGRSDYGPFIEQGIPAGGLFSGAEDLKTAEQVSLFGGVEGEQLDPCYHEVCDTYDSVFAFPPELPQLEGNGAESLDDMSDAVAHATWHFVTERKPLGKATKAKRPDRLQPYRLPYRGPERTAAR